MSTQDSPQPKPNRAQRSWRTLVSWVGAPAAVILCIITALALLVGTATVLTGRPDGGAFGDGGIFGSPANDSRNDTPEDAGDVVVDLDNDGRPDTRLDLNGDGDTTDADDPTLASLTQARDDLLAQLSPTTPSNKSDDEAETAEAAALPEQALVTPGTKKWWNLATSAAPNLYLWEQPAPEASFYAVATAQAAKPRTSAQAEGAPAASRYDAFYIAFPDSEAARAYAEKAARAQDGQWRSVLVRDNLLVFTPSWVYPENEPFPSAKKQLAGLKTAQPKAASWYRNIGDQNANMVAETVPAYRKALAATFTSLGFTPETKWSSVSTNPNGPWVGTLTDYKPSAIDFMSAARALASTVTSDCGPDNGNSVSCVETDLGLTELADAWIYRQSGEAALGIGRNTNALSKKASKNAILNFATQDSYARGIINKTSSNFRTPVSVTRGWITKGNVMTLITEEGRAPRPPTEKNK